MLADLTIERLHAGYTNGLSPATVIDQVYATIAKADDPGIFITLLAKSDVKKAVRALGAFDPLAKPLWGVPFAVKDNIDTAGLPTTAGCPEFAYTAKASAFAVQKLIDAGAILIGKTNLDQFATGLVGVRTPYDIPRNSIDATLVPGGSSSGSAVGVARGIVSFALGTDTAGSGRVPAALNNIVGLKPSLGAVSTAGVVPACRTLDCVSVFALTVGDAWRVFTVMAGADASDPYSRPISLGAANMPPVLRVGVPSRSSREFFGDARAEGAFDASLKALSTLGVTVTEIDLTPFREVASLLYDGPWVAERYQAIRAFIESVPEALHPVTRAIITGATSRSAADAFAGLYRLTELRQKTEPIWREIDVLLVPSVPTIATLADMAADPIGPNSRLGTYTNFVNLLDLCALAVPGRWRTDKLPAGVTLIAPRGQDAVLAGLGARLHAASGVKLGALEAAVPHAREIAPAVPPGAMEIVVVGAHMSGLALNQELKAHGGQFVRANRTEPCYRLYALTGGPPARPGLLRVAAGKGHAIEAEVWALPSASFGAFVAGIPAPLGIATIRLADGSTAKGFVTEAEGVADARDISHLGSWRAYLAQSQPKSPARRRRT